MTIDFSSIVWLFFALMLLQPILRARWYVAQRARAIRAIERVHGSRVITMIHRQEKRACSAYRSRRHIDLEDAQTVIAAIKETPEDMPIDFVIHTPGGLVLAAMQIARALQAHKAKVTVFVPVFAMSGGTLIALAADEIVLGEFSVLGPIDPQIGAPASGEHRQSARRQADRARLRSHAGSRRRRREGDRAGQARRRRVDDAADGTGGGRGARRRARRRPLDSRLRADRGGSGRAGPAGQVGNAARGDAVDDALSAAGSGFAGRVSADRVPAPEAALRGSSEHRVSNRRQTADDNNGGCDVRTIPCFCMS